MKCLSHVIFYIALSYRIANKEFCARAQGCIYGVLILLSSLKLTRCKYLTIMLLLFYCSKTYYLLSMYDWCMLQQGAVALARGAGTR